MVDPAGLILSRAEVAQRGMKALAVVERLDELEDDGPAGLGSCGPGAPIDELHLQGGEPSLGHGVVPTLAGTGEALADLVLGQEVRELLGRVPYLFVVYDSYDNALAESVIGLYKSELIQSSRPPITLSNTWPTRPGTTKSSLYRTRGGSRLRAGIQLDGDVSAVRPRLRSAENRRRPAPRLQPHNPRKGHLLRNCVIGTGQDLTPLRQATAPRTSDRSAREVSAPITNRCPSDGRGPERRPSPRILQPAPPRWLPNVCHPLS